MTDRTKDVNPDLLEAEAYELLARAKRIRAAQTAPSPDELLDGAAMKARYHVDMRVIVDAARRGELVVEHVGRKPVVRVRAMEAWIASRATKAKVTDAPEDTASSGVTSIERAAKRLRRAS